MRARREATEQAAAAGKVAGAASGEASLENDLGRTSKIKILHGQSETPRLAGR